MEDLVVLHEDNHLLVVLKSQGISMASGKGASVKAAEEVERQELGATSDKGAKDLTSMAQAYLNSGKPKGVKSFCIPVYLLDKPVGGVVVFAKSAKALNRLNTMKEDGSLERVYYAVSQGLPKQRADTVANYVKQTIASKGLELVPQFTTGAVRAELSFNLCDQVDDFALLKVISSDVLPKQARLQLFNLGCPIYGDATFGTPQRSAHLALWLTDVRFTHPVTGRVMTFRAFPPEDEEPWKKFNVQLLLKVI